MKASPEVLERIGDISNRITIASGGTSVFLGWFTTEHVLSLVAAVCTVVGVVVTWYYKRVAAERLAAEAVRRAEIHALDVESRQLQLEELRAHIQLLRSGHCVAPAVHQALAELDTDLGKLEADLGKMSAGNPVKMEADE